MLRGGQPKKRTCRALDQITARARTGALGPALHTVGPVTVWVDARRPGGRITLSGPPLGALSASLVS
ncbi:hypothetical protein Psi01_65370 [Planobispora siamensis]|uniref:Uncharacterized protein n=1 Tax=Planobispora siamensis TaxID=936338 RepID=A0A8J3SN72_9ACTN|nr:hypothetical protein Psi01_65370 [Planobispora siamensis]